jgi:hypothetical protein
VAKRDYDADVAHHAAVSLCAVLIAINLYCLVFAPFPLDSAVTLSRLVVVGWNLALLALVWLARNTRRLTMGLVAFGLALVPMGVVWWTLIRVHNEHYFEWEPLLRQKFVFAIVALFVPPRLWLGLLVMALVATEALLEYWLGGLHAQPGLWVHDPWATLVAAGVGVLIMLLRTRDLSHEREAAARLERLQATEKIALMSLAVRDLANTPLQTLAASLALLERECPEAERFLPRMQRSLGRLTELNELLRRYELPDGSIPASLDSTVLLEQQLRTPAPQ